MPPAKPERPGRPHRVAPALLLPLLPLRPLLRLPLLPLLLLPPLLLATGIPQAGNDLDKPPLTVPLFDGAERSHQPPQAPLQRPAIPDYRRLFDLTLACWPAKSWFRGDLTLEARAGTPRHSGAGASADVSTGAISAGGERYVALVARIPLMSATELDKERNREAERRGKIAEAVGNLVSAYAERVMQLRQLQLLQALEKRAQERVRLGVAETAEQVRYLEQVAALETRIQALQGDEIKARLHVLGMCDEPNMARIDAYLDNFHR